MDSSVADISDSEVLWTKDVNTNARGVRIVISNNLPTRLVLNVAQNSAEWACQPPSSINPNSKVKFGCLTHGWCSGVEGSLSYTNGTEQFSLNWSNPYSFFSSASVTAKGQGLIASVRYSLETHADGYLLVGMCTLNPLDPEESRDKLRKSGRGLDDSGILENVRKGYESAINAFIRPPRAHYDPMTDLGPSHFLLGDTDISCTRTDFTITNPWKEVLQCSWFSRDESSSSSSSSSQDSVLGSLPQSSQPLQVLESGGSSVAGASDTPTSSPFQSRKASGQDGGASTPLRPQRRRRPCVVYCHANSGSRLNAKPLVALLVPHGVDLVCFDFSGSGLSDGAYVTLGSREHRDIECVVKHLRNSGRCSRIALWGRSMGAVAALLYARMDVRLAAVVSDSAFSDLPLLVEQLMASNPNSQPQGSSSPPPSYPNASSTSAPLSSSPPPPVSSSPPPPPPPSSAVASVLTQSHSMAPDASPSTASPHRTPSKISSFLVRGGLMVIASAIEQRCDLNVYDVCPIRDVPYMRIPLLFVHGTRDTVVPLSHSEKLYDEYGGQDKLLLKVEQGHNSSRPAETNESIVKFLLLRLTASLEEYRRALSKSTLE